MAKFLPYPVPGEKGNMGGDRIRLSLMTNRRWDKLMNHPTLTRVGRRTGRGRHAKKMSHPTLTLVGRRKR